MLKSHIRKKIIKLREIKNKKNLQVKTSFFKQILKTKKFKNKIVGSYFPVNFEADTFHIMKMLKQKGFKLSLPVISSKFNMNFYYWNLDEPLHVNKFGIPEPSSGKIKFPDILLIPLLSFDKKLNRVGYGGGFYDRYIHRIKRKKKPLLIGLAYSFQRVKSIPFNRYDKKLDFVVTEKKIIE